MILKLDNLHLTEGRLLVIPQQASRNQVLEVSEVREVSWALVVKANVPGIEINPGDRVVYDRLHSEEISLEDDEGVKKYRFMLWRDVAAFENVTV